MSVKSFMETLNKELCDTDHGKKDPIWPQRSYLIFHMF